MTIVQRIGLLVVAVSAIFALTACGGGGSSTPVVPIFNCGPSGVDPAAKLVSPASGATGVSPAIGTIAYSYGYGALAQPEPGTMITLHPNNGGADVRATFKSSANGVATAAVSALAAGTTYTAAVTTVNVAHIVGCDQPATGALGSFTTQ